jgi:hypothetical protein
MPPKLLDARVADIALAGQKRDAVAREHDTTLDTAAAFRKNNAHLNRDVKAAAARYKEMYAVAQQATKALNASCFNLAKQLGLEHYFAVFQTLATDDDYRYYEIPHPYDSVDTMKAAADYLSTTLTSSDMVWSERKKRAAGFVAAYRGMFSVVYADMKRYEAVQKAVDRLLSDGDDGFDVKIKAIIEEQAEAAKAKEAELSNAAPITACIEGDAGDDSSGCEAPLCAGGDDDSGCAPAVSGALHIGVQPEPSKTDPSWQFVAAIIGALLPAAARNDTILPLARNLHKHLFSDTAQVMHFGKILLLCSLAATGVDSAAIPHAATATAETVRKFADDTYRKWINETDAAVRAHFERVERVLDAFVKKGYQLHTEVGLNGLIGDIFGAFAKQPLPSRNSHVVTLSLQNATITGKIAAWLTFIAFHHRVMGNAEQMFQFVGEIVTQGNFSGERALKSFVGEVSAMYLDALDVVVAFDRDVVHRLGRTGEHLKWAGTDGTEELTERMLRTVLFELLYTRRDEFKAYNDVREKDIAEFRGRQWSILNKIAVANAEGSAVRRRLDAMLGGDYKVVHDAVVELAKSGVTGKAQRMEDMEKALADFDPNAINWNVDPQVFQGLRLQDVPAAASSAALLAQQQQRGRSNPPPAAAASRPPPVRAAAVNPRQPPPVRSVPAAAAQKNNGPAAASNAAIAETGLMATKAITVFADPRSDISAVAKNVVDQLNSLANGHKIFRFAETSEVNGASGDTNTIIVAGGSKGVMSMDSEFAAAVKQHVVNTLVITVKPYDGNGSVRVAHETSSYYDVNDHTVHLNSIALFSNQSGTDILTNKNNSEALLTLARLFKKDTTAYHVLRKKGAEMAGRTVEQLDADANRKLGLLVTNLTNKAEKLKQEADRIVQALGQNATIDQLHEASGKLNEKLVEIDRLMTSNVNKPEIRNAVEKYRADVDVLRSDLSKRGQRLADAARAHPQQHTGSKSITIPHNQLKMTKYDPLPVAVDIVGFQMPVNSSVSDTTPYVGSIVLMQNRSVVAAAHAVQRAQSQAALAGAERWIVEFRRTESLADGRSAYDLAIDTTGGAVITAASPNVVSAQVFIDVANPSVPIPNEISITMVDSTLYDQATPKHRVVANANFRDTDAAKSLSFKVLLSLPQNAIFDANLFKIFDEHVFRHINGIAPQVLPDQPVDFAIAPRNTLMRTGDECTVKMDVRVQEIGSYSVRFKFAYGTKTWGDDPQYVAHFTIGADVNKTAIDRATKLDNEVQTNRTKFDRSNLTVEELDAIKVSAEKQKKELEQLMQQSGISEQTKKFIRGGALSKAEANLQRAGDALSAIRQRQLLEERERNLQKRRKEEESRTQEAVAAAAAMHATPAVAQQQQQQGGAPAPAVAAPPATVAVKPEHATAAASSSSPPQAPAPAAAQQHHQSAPAAASSSPSPVVVKPEPAQAAVAAGAASAAAASPPKIAEIGVYSVKWTGSNVSKNGHWNSWWVRPKVVNTSGADIVLNTLKVVAELVNPDPNKFTFGKDITEFNLTKINAGSEFTGDKEFNSKGVSRIFNLKTVGTAQDTAEYELVLHLRRVDNDSEIDTCKLTISAAEYKDHKNQEITIGNDVKKL